MAIISGLPDMVVYVAAAGLVYYVFIYETDEAKAKRLELARRKGLHGI